MSDSNGCFHLLLLNADSGFSTSILKFGYYNRFLRLDLAASFSKKASRTKPVQKSRLLNFVFAA